MFVHRTMMTQEQKEKASKLTGKLILWILEGRNVDYMAKCLDLHPWQVEHDMEEALYVLKKQVGLKRYLKVLFMR